MFIGGFIGPSNRVVYNGVHSLEGDKWTTDLAVMRTPRGGHSCAFFNNKIYVMGGLDKDGSQIRSTDIYDLVSDKWSKGPDLPRTGHLSHAVTYENELYVAGGFGSNGRVWKLNSAETAWDKIANTAHTGDRKFSSAQVIKSDSCMSTPPPTTLPPTPPSTGEERNCLYKHFSLLYIYRLRMECQYLLLELKMPCVIS